MRLVSLKHVEKYARSMAALSNDPHTKVGAVLCQDAGIGKALQILAGSANMIMHRGDNASFERPLKYDRVIHAELRVIGAACRSGHYSTLGKTMVITHPPCLECAKAILASGISHLHIGPETYQSRTAEGDIAAEFMLQGIKITRW